MSAMRVTAQEYQVLIGMRKPDEAKKPRRKYHNEPTVVGGIRFDSKREAARWSELQLEQREGHISKLRRQVAFALNVGEENIGKIVVDFVYTRGGATVYEDVKSDATVTPIFKWKARHFAAQYGKEISLCK